MKGIVVLDLSEVHRPKYGWEYHYLTHKYGVSISTDRDLWCAGLGITYFTFNIDSRTWFQVKLTSQNMVYPPPQIGICDARALFYIFYIQYRYQNRRVLGLQVDTLIYVDKWWVELIEVADIGVGHPSACAGLDLGKKKFPLVTLHGRCGDMKPISASINQSIIPS